MKKLQSIIAAALSAACVNLPALSAETAAPAQTNEAVRLLSQYIRINTTNPPGNETLGANFLAERLRNEGIEAQLFETEKGRSCVYARLKGNGKKRAIILLNHIDVVPANAADWQHDPFGGEIIEGELWGRGAMDMKSMAIAELMAMLEIKRSGKTMDRDVIFLATPDEEVGGTYGAVWFAKNHPELVKDAEYLLNEGFSIDTAENGRPKYWGVDVSEKSVLWLKLTAHGDAGHASMPMPDSAPNRLVRALTRVVNAPPAPEVLPAVQEYFKEIAPEEQGALRAAYANIADAVKQPGTYAEILKDKMRSSMLRNTVSLTVIKSGYKTNVIPAEATAELDCRLLPNANKDQFIREIKAKVDDPLVEVSQLDWVHAEASAYKTPLFEAIKEVAAKEEPGVPVVPLVVLWFTDSHNFRDFGTVAYGFEPFHIDATHLATMHGKNERIPVASFVNGVRILREIVETVDKKD